MQGKEESKSENKPNETKSEKEWNEKKRKIGAAGGHSLPRCPTLSIEIVKQWKYLRLKTYLNVDPFMLQQGPILN